MLQTQTKRNQTIEIGNPYTGENELKADQITILQQVSLFLRPHSAHNMPTDP